MSTILLSCLGLAALVALGVFAVRELATRGPTPEMEWQGQRVWSIPADAKGIPDGVTIGPWAWWRLYLGRTSCRRSRRRSSPASPRGRLAPLRSTIVDRSEADTAR